MKVVIITLDDAKKTGLEGADKLAKTDLIIILSAKAKSEMPATVKEALAEIKAENEFVKLDSAADKDVAYAYYAGYHDGKNHSTFIVATDKTKVPKLASKSAKVYTNFKSVGEASGTTTSSSSGKKTSSGKKKTSSKKDEGILESLASGEIDTDKLIKEAAKKAKKFIKEVTKEEK